MYTFKVHLRCFHENKRPNKKVDSVCRINCAHIHVTTGHPSAPDISATDVQCKHRTGAMFVMRLVIKFLLTISVQCYISHKHEKDLVPIV